MTKSLFWPLFALLIILTGAAKATTLENNPPSFQGANRPFTLLSPVDPAPSAPIYTLSGGVTTLKRFVGKVVVLNLWATWCPACVFELPTLGKLQANMGGDTFTVVALAIDEGGAKAVSAYLKTIGLDNLPIYLDPTGRLLAALKVGNAQPLSVLIDHQRRVMGYMKGAADWSSAQARALIDYYIRRISP